MVSNIKINLTNKGWGVDNEFIEADLIDNGESAKITGFPKLVDGIHHEDIVTVLKDGEDYIFDGIKLKSGWYGIRVVFLNKDILAEKMYNLLGLFQDFNVSIEKPFYLVSTLSFPPNANKEKVFEILKKIESQEKIEFEEF